MFSDRVEAGRRLAERLGHLQGEGVVVLGLPRGGVPVAYQVAQALGAPLDVIVVRKLGVPYQPELAMGAIGEDGVRIVNEDIVAMAGVSPEELQAVEEREREELARRARIFRGDRRRVELQDRVVVIVDDGIATGSTVRAAAQVARAQGAARVIVATPVAPREAKDRLAADADEVVVVDSPEPFHAIGQFYLDFEQTPDAEVSRLLDQSPAVQETNSPSSNDPAGLAQEVEVEAGGHRLGGHLTVPEGSSGTILFAHGSGSSRHSPRNQYVAEALNGAGLGTLLFDLLTPEEELDRDNVFDIELLAGRLVDATAWMASHSTWPGSSFGYFGASTGAAAALWAAAELGTEVSAVVSRGGRPDLASPVLSEVQAPTLLIVGGNDSVVLDLNRAAQAELRCENRLEVVPGAGHLFEEPGALDQVAELAVKWFSSRVGR